MKITLDELLNSPLFKQALFDVQVEECERYQADTKTAGLSPGGWLLFDYALTPAPQNT